MSDEQLMVLRHIREAAKRIARHEEIIDHLASLGAETTLSENVLENIRDAQTLRFQHLRRIRPR